MSNDFFEYIPLTLACVVGLYFAIRFTLIARDTYNKHKAAEQAPLPSAHPVLWRDPGAVERLDLAAGPGGRAAIPVPPFRFAEEHTDGSQPCVSVHDARGRRWRVKWGHEVQCETFAVRLAWACGYFAEVTHLVHSGRIEGAGRLRRAAAAIEPSGAFVDGRFELDDPAVEKYFAERSWSLDRQPLQRHAGAGGPQGPTDAAVELGQQGSARRVARIEHRDLRHARARRCA